MATLNIGGTKVKVGDEFLRMTPEQQGAAVEEISASLGLSASQPAPQDNSGAPVLDPYGAEPNNFARAIQGSGPVAPRNGPRAAGRPDLAGATASTLAGLIEGIPIVGPAIQNTSDALIGTGAVLTGGNYDETIQGLRNRREELKQANPIANIAGQVASPVAAFGAAAKAPAAASALGLTGPLRTQVVNGAVTNSLLNSVDSLVRGGDTATAAAVGGATGAAGPLIGRAVETAGRAIGNRFAPIIDSVLDPAGEASRRVGLATGRDRTAGQAISQADELVAAQAGVPLTNADRGGEVTRALSRSVANQSPEARATLTRVANDRFETQGPRAINFITRLAGGNVNDVGATAALKAAARATNNPAYKAAYSSPQARAIWTPEIANLMQATPFRNAINAAESTATNAAAVSGGKAVRNPFVFRPDGTATLRELPGGGRALPNLEFWDIVQRNLREASEEAARGGKNLLASQIGDMRRQLNNVLDTAVPQFGQARAGAASFFGAEDAIDAGRMFANQPRAIPEARVAFDSFTDAEKAAFRTGYASELIDKIKAGGDRRNIIQQTFGNQASREQVELVFGSMKARELEAYVKVEALADQLRGALGNSTTARQLVELGLGGAAGGIYTGDWQGIVGGAALAKGARYAGERIDARVMEKVAELLTSGTRADLDKAVANATLSDEWMKAITALIGSSTQAGIATSSFAMN